jgi:hypothetical protein
MLLYYYYYYYFYYYNELPLLLLHYYLLLLTATYYCCYYYYYYYYYYCYLLLSTTYYYYYRVVATLRILGELEGVGPPWTHRVNHNFCCISALLAMVTARYFHLAELVRYGTFLIFIAITHVEQWVRHIEILNAYCSWICYDKRSVKTLTGVPLERRLLVSPSRADAVFRNCMFRH